MKLGDALRIKHGFAFAGEGFRADPDAPQVLTPGNFALNGGFQEAKPKSYVGAYPPEYLLTGGEVVVTMTDLSKAGDTLGFAAKLPIGGQYLHNQRIGLVEVTRPDLLSADYFHYLTRTAEYRAHILGTASGSTVRHTSPARISDFDARLPPLGEQQAIAEVLGALDDKIAANTKLATTINDLARTILEASLDYTTMRRLDEAAEISMGSSPQGSTFNESGDGLPFFQGVRDFGIRWPTERVYTIAPTRIAEIGDILVSVRAPVGEINIASTALCIGRGLAAVRSRTNHQFTLFHLLRHVRAIWRPFDAEGTVFASINGPQLKGLLIPAVHDADTLEARLAPLERRLASALRENAVLAATRDALLPQLMSGKLRVRDAELAIEEVGV